MPSMLILPDLPRTRAGSSPLSRAPSIDPPHEELIARSRLRLQHLELLDQVAELLLAVAARVEIGLVGLDLLADAAQRIPFVVAVDLFHRVEDQAPRIGDVLAVELGRLRGAGGVARLLVDVLDRHEAVAGVL